MGLLVNLPPVGGPPVSQGDQTFGEPEWVQSVWSPMSNAPVVVVSPMANAVYVFTLLGIDPTEVLP